MEMRSILVLVVVTTLILILGRKKSEPEVEMPTGNRLDRLDEAYLFFKLKLEEHLALPSKDQRAWIVSFLNKKIAEIEAEYILSLRGGK